MKEFVATLYFDSAENALNAGYCEAVESDAKDGGYMYEATFKADDVVITLGDSLHRQQPDVRGYADANNP
ncbi:MAG: hypothetical protein L7U64_03925 [Luminiphilus sp.]|nr:hypothetical protein [Luminiphilus sp.]